MTLKKRLFTVGLSMVVATGFGVFTPVFAGEHGTAHWAYEGEGGPEHWGGMSKDYAACSQGKSQSPVDITGAADEKLDDIAFNYKPSKAVIENNGHTIQVNYEKGSGNTIKAGGVEYELVQFHFHDPSEHTVRGKSYGMELHLVHKNVDGKLAVVGVLIDTGAEGGAYKEIWNSFPKKAGDKKELKAPINANDLLPKERLYYKYSGSLTTPPCSEIVTWLVIKTPVQMSKAQVDAFKGIVKMNARPTQPLNGRRISAEAAGK
ncbi:carbonic anhydrase family protein [bacterium]|nr:MAG: carbonic anhydrase family protein [bacterium]